MKNITVTIDDKTVTVPEGTTIMQAADKVGTHIPRLCYHPFLSTEGACRVCIVEVEGMRNYAVSCATQASAGMKIKTHSNQMVR